jgi:hypothetical protein
MRTCVGGERVHVAYKGSSSTSGLSHEPEDGSSAILERRTALEFSSSRSNSESKGGWASLATSPAREGPEPRRRSLRNGSKRRHQGSDAAVARGRTRIASSGARRGEGRRSSGYGMSLPLRRISVCVAGSQEQTSPQSAAPSARDATPGAFGRWAFGATGIAGATAAQQLARQPDLLAEVEHVGGADDGVLSEARVARRPIPRPDPSTIRRSSRPLQVLLAPERPRSARGPGVGLRDLR